MIERHRHVEAVRGLLDRHPVVAIVGARQVGKTTLARMVSDRTPSGSVRPSGSVGPSGVTWFDLDAPRDEARLASPSLALSSLTGLVVIDEVQRRPDLFPLLRVLADRPGTPARFLVLGSASPYLLRQSSESLAGRIAYHEMGGFSLDETGAGAWETLWWRGGFPRSFLAATDADSAEWRREFVRAFLERDLAQLGVTIPAPTLRRFWSMLAHYHGQVWNSSEFARSFGVADTTVRRYLDLLSAAFVVRQLQPWHENLGKRQVRSPKVYVADPGLLHTLLGLEAPDDVLSHPKAGASWEGFALGVVAGHLCARSDQTWFWATHGGAELDLLVTRGRERRGFEFKLTDAPRVTRSMRSAIEDLHLDSLDVVHAGEETFPLGERIRGVALRRVPADVEP